MLKELNKYTVKIKRSLYDTCFELITSDDLTENDLIKLQELRGYPVNGYSFYLAKKYKRNYNTNKIEYRYTWQCYNSCD